jgi:hypothetical protein
MWVWWHYSAFGSATIIVQVGHVDALSLYTNHFVVGAAQSQDEFEFYSNGDQP